jgi:ATP-dependent DNA helicase PIF1
MNILDEARIGELSAQSVQVLRRHGNLPSAAFGHTSQDNNAKIIPTLLECRNKNVDQANEREMAKLKGDTHTFHARDRAIADNYKGQLKQCQAPAVLELKVGAQVMLLKNVDLDKGLANGSRGVVVRFQPPTNER